MIKITIPGVPYPSPRPRFRNAGKFTQTYMPSAYMKEKDKVANQVKKLVPEGFELIEGPIIFSAIFYMPIPKSLSKVKKEALNGTYHIKKPDRDNLLKTYQDALEGILYKNDSQICDGTPKKFYSDKPRVELIIKAME